MKYRPPWTVRIDFAGIVTSDNLSVSRHTVSARFGYIHIDTSILDPVFSAPQMHTENGSTNVACRN